jgi:hypothetical protein
MSVAQRPSSTPQLEARSVLDAGVVKVEKITRSAWQPRRRLATGDCRPIGAATQRSIV